MALIGKTSIATAASAASATGSAITPPQASPGEQPYNHAVVFTTAFSDTAATGTIAAKLQGSMDGSSWADVLLLPNDTDTAAATFTKTTASTFIWFVAQSRIRRFQQYRLVTSSNTNILYTADFVTVS